MTPISMRLKKNEIRVIAQFENNMTQQVSFKYFYRLLFDIYYLYSPIQNIYINVAIGNFTRQSTW